MIRGAFPGNKDSFSHGDHIHKDEYLGTYQGYYKRNRPASERIVGWDKLWFEGKRVLDIGANEGAVTLKVAELFSPRIIVGIDIDQRLIDAANSAVKRAKYAVSKVTNDHAPKVAPSSELTSNKASHPMKLFVPRAVIGKSTKLTTTANRENPLPLYTSSRSDSNTDSQSVPDSGESRSFPFNITFRFDDFRTMPLLSTTIYEAIVCLSVTKWVHLNDGDVGLLNFFNKINCHLKTQGYFVLEYQHWKSYVQNRLASDHIRSVFKTLCLRPDDFEELLTNEFGFEIIARLGVSLTEAKGFMRPILVLKKVREFSLGAVLKLNLTSVSGEDGVLTSLEIQTIIDRIVMNRTKAMSCLPRGNAADGGREPEEAKGDATQLTNSNEIRSTVHLQDDEAIVETEHSQPRKKKRKKSTHKEM